MRSKMFAICLITGGFLLCLVLGPVARAQPPDINIDLAFDQLHYNTGDPVGVSITVSNDTGKDLLISKDFSTMDYIMKLEIVDPAGRMLSIQHDEFHEEFPDAPPLPWGKYNGNLVRLGRCDVLPAGWEEVSEVVDLRDYFEMTLPGYYTAKVSISAMTFKCGDGGTCALAACDVNDAEWSGVLESYTTQFQMDGATKVNMFPIWWLTMWADGRYIFSNIRVLLWPEEGQEIGAYDKTSIRLNNVEAVSVVERYSFWKRQPYLDVRFNKKEAIQSLGAVVVGERYPVMVSGRLTSGHPFGGNRMVRIVR